MVKSGSRLLTSTYALVIGSGTFDVHPSYEIARGAALVWQASPFVIREYMASEGLMLKSPRNTYGTPSASLQRATTS